MLLLQGHTNFIHDLAYSSDGRFLASASADHSVRVWNLNGELIQTMELGSAWSSAVAFSNDGKRLLVGGYDGRATLLALKGDQSLKSLDISDGAISTVAFSLDDQWIALGAYRGGLKLIQLDGRKTRTLKLLDTERDIFTARFHPEGHLLALGGYFNSVYLVEIKPSGPGAIEKLTGTGCRGCRDLAFSPEGQLLALALPGGAELWNIEQRQRLSLFDSHDRPVSAVAFTSDGQTLLTGSWDGTVRVWDVESGNERAAYDWEVGSIYTLAIAPDDMTAAVGGARNDVVIQNLTDEVLS